MLSSSVEHYRDLAISFFHSSKSGRRRGKSGQPKNGGGRMSSSEAKQSLLAMERLLLQLTHHAHHLGRSCVESLVAELKLVRDEELRLRWHLQQSGISNAIHIPHAIELQPVGQSNAKQVDQQDDLDVKRQCIVCQHICCLSAVVCSCSPVDVACIRTSISCASVRASTSASCTGSRSRTWTRPFSACARCWKPRPATKKAATGAAAARPPRPRRPRT